MLPRMSCLLFRRPTNLEQYISRHQKSVVTTVFQTPSQNPQFSLIHLATAHTSIFSFLDTSVIALYHYITNIKTTTKLTTTINDNSQMPMFWSCCDETQSDSQSLGTEHRYDRSCLVASLCVVTVTWHSGQTVPAHLSNNDTLQ